jgi:hypothetical protein
VLALARKAQGQQTRPSAEDRAEGFGVQRPKNREEDILRRWTMRHLEEARQPLGIGFAPQLHGLRVIGSADHRHQRNDDHGPQGVALPLGTSCVGQLRERSLKERQSLKLKLLRKQLLLAETWHGPTSASRAPCPLQRFDQKSRSPSTAFDPFGENSIALPFRTALPFPVNAEVVARWHREKCKNRPT